MSPYVQYLLSDIKYCVLYIAVLDCSRAFALAKWEALFERLLARLPAIVVRVLLYSYANRHAWARWGKANSGTFEIRNGTREGSML